jgi:hypothetical protein
VPRFYINIGLINIGLYITLKKPACQLSSSKMGTLIKVLLGQSCGGCCGAAAGFTPSGARFVDKVPAAKYNAGVDLATGFETGTAFRFKALVLTLLVLLSAPQPWEKSPTARFF